MNSANENAARANKKTIRPEDVIEAAKELEFGAFVPQLQAALQGMWMILNHNTSKPYKDYSPLSLKKDTMTSSLRN